MPLIIVALFSAQAAVYAFPATQRPTGKSALATFPSAGEAQPKHVIRRETNPNAKAPTMPTSEDARQEVAPITLLQRIKGDIDGEHREGLAPKSLTEGALTENVLGYGQARHVNGKHLSRPGDHLSEHGRAEPKTSLSYEANAKEQQQQQDPREQHQNQSIQNRIVDTHRSIAKLVLHDTAADPTHLSMLQTELVERSVSLDFTHVMKTDIMFAILLVVFFAISAVIAHSCSSNNVYASNERRDPVLPGRQTVVLVHGYTSCSLLTNTQLCYINMTKLWLRFNMRLKPSRGRLSDGTEVACTANAHEDVRVVTGTKGIRTLNPGHRWPDFKIWDALIEALCPRYNVVAVNYDWRRWGDETYMEKYVFEFRGAIEAAVKSTGVATVVSHSMGGPVVAYCLSKCGLDWQKRTIAQHITLSPAFCGSSRAAYEFATEHHDISFGCLRFAFLPIAIQGTWPSAYTLLPKPTIGSVHMDTGRPFVVTPSRAYTRDDAGLAFVQDLSNVFSAERPFLKEIGLNMWSSISKANQDINDPAIPTHVICGVGFETVAQATYSNDQFSGNPDLSYEDGDDTVLAQPLKDLVAGWKAAGKPVEIHACTASHKTIIVAEFTISKILELLRSREL